MDYQVSARKYRPAIFQDVIGQPHVVQTLSNAIASNRIAHAFLFSGTRGVGKTTMARILAKALNCEKGPTATPCDACVNCREITQGNSVDVIEIDGQFLGEVPYQERRRLLGGLITEGVRLRVTPSVKMPLGSWFHAWQENGFRQAVAKHANSRYEPGAATQDWIVISIQPDRAPGAQGLFWKGRKKREIKR